jgi:hypothetical protein
VKGNQATEIERLMLLCTTASAFPSRPRQLRPSPGSRSFARSCCRRSMRYKLFRLAAGARMGFALFGNGFFARVSSEGGLRAFHGTPGTLRCCWSNRASLLGGFSSNSAYHPTDNSANRSCYTTSRGSGDSPGGLLWDGRDFDVFG